MSEEYDYLIKTCLFGDKNVGKKTFIKSKFIIQNLDNTNPDILGVTLTTKQVEFDGKVIRLHFWIVSDDEERFQQYWNKYIRGSLGAIIMYDIIDSKTLDRVSRWIDIIKNNTKDIPILLVGNKIDLEEHREVSKEQVDRFKKQYDISSSMEISVKTGENVEEMFLNLVSMIVEIDFEEYIETNLEEKRDYLIWIIDRAIKKKRDKFEGKRKLKKQKKLWRKKYFGVTETFEEYLKKENESILSLGEFKNEILNAKDYPEILKVWEKVNELLNP